MRRWPIVIVAAALGVAGCGASSTTSSHTGVVKAHILHASSAVVRNCSSSQLRLSFAGSNGATGHVEMLFALRNSSGRACDLFGYPGAQLLDSQGRVLALRVQHGGGAMPDSRQPPHPVKLFPGSAAQFSLTFADNNEYSGGGRCPVASALASTPPTGGAWLRITLAGGGRPRFAPCGGTIVSSPLYPAV